MPEQPKPDAGYSIQSLVAAVARASEPLTAAAKPGDAGLAGRLSKRKSKVRAKEEVILPASVRLQSAAEGVKSGQSRAAVAAAAAGLLLVKWKRDGGTGVRVAISVGTRKRRIAIVRKVEGTKRETATLPESLPTTGDVMVALAPSFNVSRAPEPVVMLMGGSKLRMLVTLITTVNARVFSFRVATVSRGHTSAEY